MIPRLFISEEALHQGVLDAQRGDKRAEDTVLRAVIALVQRETTYVYQLRSRGKRSEYEDLFQSACLGILQAIQKWDPSRRKPFALYAAYYARGYALNMDPKEIPEPVEAEKLEELLGATATELHGATKQRAELYLEELTTCISKRRKPKHRGVLLLRLQGKTQREIGAQLQMTHQAVSLIEREAWKELLPCLRSDLSKEQIDAMAKQLRKQGFK